LLDIKLVREHPEIVERDLQRRNTAEKTRMLRRLVDLDREWRDLLSRTNELRHKRRLMTHEIAILKKSGKSVVEQVEKARRLETEIAVLEGKVEARKQKTTDILMRLPNILHESVPLGKGEKDNLEVRVWGEPPIFDFKPMDHLSIAQNLGILDEERGAKVAGHGFLYLRGDGVLLDLALQRYAIDFLREKGFILIQPPFMMRRKPYEGVTDLADFGDVMYKVENEDLYMIATSEHPSAAMFMNEVLLEENLPVKLVAISPCFRKEVGAHGKYTKGLFRMHQFNKIEQFVFCLPEESWNIHEELQQNSEKLYQSLGLHHKVVNVCTGDIGTLAAKRYDINVWMADGIYREIGSNSNCTDYQARRLNIRYRGKEGQAPKGFVHTINNTGIATSRTMMAILEQHQQRDGSVVVPEVLSKYLNGMRKLEKNQLNLLIPESEFS
jgi:seryl-tRNA synthetase